MNDYAARLNASLVGRYEVERELGRGGMATVYLARDLRHERLVALKVLHPELASALGPERFLREIRTVARLQHPHILSVHDSGEAAGLLWFTMPFVEGESLRDRLRREHQLPLDVAVRVAHEAARALDYAHRHGVVHRDIKPENILLTNDGDTLVADFGIGRAIGASSQEERLTETGVVVGTAAYMSPEQAAGEREIDARSDVYSLGVVLYEMLAGEPPFTGPTVQAIIARRFTESPRPIRPIRETVPREVEEAVMRALARLPADRPASAAVFAQTLDSAGDATRVPSATTPHTATSLIRTRSRRKWIIGVAAVLAAAALIGTLFRTRGAGSPKLDASLLAIAPFDVLDARLTLWREGMVDLLSRNLDGAGPLRTVSPTVVVRRWSGRADPQSAAELGRATGAGLALYGSLLSSGRDSVRARATLYDVRRQSPVEEWELVDVADRVDRLGDSLTFRVLRGLGRTRPVGSVRSASLGSSSLPAVKAFLQGEQHLRRAQWDSALGYYERAILLDSTFPLALRRASTALGWTRTGFDSLSTAFAFRAGAANHGLPPRDSLLIVSDSVLASLLHAGPMGIRADISWEPMIQRLFSTLEEATTRYPDDPEAWHMLGDALDHFAPFAGRPTEELFRSFDRAIALDSAYAPSYIHPIETAASDGPEAMRRYLRPYLALNPNDRGADGLRLVQRLLDSAGVSPSDLPRLFGQLPGPALLSAFNALRRLPDTSETAIHVARFLASHPWSGPPTNDSATGRRRLAQSLLAHGHVREGYDVLRENGSLLFSDAAVLGVVPADTVAAEFRRRLSGPAGFLLAGAFPWWAGQRDTVSLRLAATHAESLARLPRSNDRASAPYVTASALAYLALAQRDTSQALQRFLALPAGGCPRCFLDRLTVAQLLAEQRKDGDAWRILKAEYPTETVHPFASEILWVLLRGRVAERVRERERALRSYAWVAGMWRNADPELQPYVAEAREGLARLTAEQN